MATHTATQQSTGLPVLANAPKAGNPVIIGAGIVFTDADFYEALHTLFDRVDAHRAAAEQRGYSHAVCENLTLQYHHFLLEETRLLSERLLKGQP